MATFVGKVTDKQVIFEVWVNLPAKEEKWIQPNSFQALLDTGSQGTMVSQKVVDQVGLDIAGSRQIMSVTGEIALVDTFDVGIHIPIHTSFATKDSGKTDGTVFRGMDLKVGLLQYEPNNHDVLLGMDFISQFHLTMYGDNYILSN